MNLDLQQWQDGDWNFVSVGGEVDLASAPELVCCLGGLACADRTVALDLRGVTFMDSSGLSSLLEAQRRIEEAGSAMVLVSPSPQVVRVLAVTGLDRVFEIIQSDDVAPADDGEEAAPIA